MSVQIGDMSFIQTAFFSGKEKNNNNKTKEIKSKRKKKSMFKKKKKRKINHKRKHGSEDRVLPLKLHNRGFFVQKVKLLPKLRKKILEQMILERLGEELGLVTKNYISVSEKQPLIGKQAHILALSGRTKTQELGSA